ncbi:MAG: error-prone DNA polymerase [Anaerolineae bacterium]|nr:error-prone DNA polymerase [Anaerolineae bacterium]
MDVEGAYTELHCHSYFSLLDGASSPESLVAYAAELGHRALAITDHDGLYGAVRFWLAAQERGIKPIFGAEVCVADGGHLVLLAETRAGYANLCRLISAAQLAGQKGSPRLDVDTLASHAGGMLCLSGCRAGRVPALLLQGNVQGAIEAAGQLREIFGGRFWIELQRHRLPSDARLLASLVSLAHTVGLDIVATNNVHYARPADRPLHDLLTSIRHRTTLSEALLAGILHPNAERCLKSAQAMSALFSELPHAIRSTVQIAERCNVALDFADQRLPEFPVPAGDTPPGYLCQLCKDGMSRKVGAADERTRAQLAHELAVIERVGLSGYFLVVWDIVRFARQRGIRCQGRGSAANSLVAYLLDITPVNPLEHDLLFERFLSEGTHTIPDIDVDFAADRREEVIQYVYERYGEERVGMVCNVVTYRARSALRDAAKALAFPPDVIDRAAKSLDTRSTVLAAEQIENALAAGGDTEAKELPWHVLADLLRAMEGVPRHLSIHVGGMLVTMSPLVEIVPLERATMPGRVVVQWDKYSVEDAGLIKVDLLALRTLGMVEEAVAHIRACGADPPDLDQLPLDDPKIYETLQRADTIGCFQVESRAQMQMLPKLKPVCFGDVVIGISLVRPGPIQGNMVHPYLRRRRGDEPVVYAHPALQPILAETLGVMVFQEQVIRVAVAIARFTPAEADQLRRAISRNRSPEEMEALHERFVEKAQRNGVTHEVAEQVYGYLLAFSGYGFCKSHAAAFAHIAYQTLHLKVYYPAAFYCALLNHQPMGFYGPDILVGDARRHGVPVFLPDINHSQERCALAHAGSALGIRLGLSYVHGLGEVYQQRIVERRGSHPFEDLRDFCRRTRIPAPMVERLIRAGGMDSLGLARRDLLWQLGVVAHDEPLDLPVPVLSVDLPELSALERTLWEYELLGLTPDHHLLGFYRDRLRKRGVLGSLEVGERRHGEIVRVAGLVVVRQRPPSAKGYAFVTLEDEDGLINLIVRPRVYEQYHDVLHRASVLLAEGTVQREGEQLNVIVVKLAMLGS